MKTRTTLAILCATALVSAPGVVSLQMAGASQPARLSAANAGPQDRAVTLPPGFSDTVVQHVIAPTALAWTPDGRRLVTTKAGSILVTPEGEQSTVALDLSDRVCDQGERGLVGVAVDPGFANNHFVYVYFTHKVAGSCGDNGPNPENQVARYVLDDDNLIDPGSATVLIDHIVSPGEHHIAGDLEFGADKLLYVSVGDGVCGLTGQKRCGPLNDNSLVPRLPHGKILRVTRNGIAPASNPYAQSPNARRCTRPAGIPGGNGPCKEIFASGFRNPFRIARKPDTSEFYINDVGLHTWEEVDRLVKGKNYGWNVREGHCARDSKTNCGPSKYTNPIHDYVHGECRSITGGAFVPQGLWPGYDDSYLYADFACGKAFRLVPKAGGGFTRSTFMSGAEGPVHLRFGPHGDTSALYYLSYFGNTVHRVTRAQANSAPVAEFGYEPDGKDVSFTGDESYDPDTGDTVATWTWDFGDGTEPVDTPEPTTEHTYADVRAYEVTLTVTDSRGMRSEPTTQTVHSGEHPPEITITEPSPAALFSVGQEVTLSAVATDQEDGPLPGSAISWIVRKHHANHDHPHGDADGQSSMTTTYPAPEELAATQNSYLAATATVTDSNGLQASVTQKLMPRTVELRFGSAPAGARLVIEGANHRAPATIVSWARHVFPVRAPDQRINGKPYVFKRWSNGRNREHNIVTRGEKEYVATFVRK